MRYKEAKKTKNKKKKRNENETKTKTKTLASVYAQQAEKQHKHYKQNEQHKQKEKTGEFHVTVTSSKRRFGSNNQMMTKLREIQSMQVGDCCVSVSTRDVLLLAMSGYT